jgi:hypothetical protein
VRTASFVLVAAALLAIAAAIYFRPQPRSDFARQVRWCHDTIANAGGNPTNTNVISCLRLLNGGSR